MHALDAGVGRRVFRGQFGFIPFEAPSRLPRHVHIEEDEGQEPRLVAECILVVNGVALAELARQLPMLVVQPFARHPLVVRLGLARHRHWRRIGAR